MTQEASKNIYQRILGVMADVDYIEKGSNKVNGQYRFVSHDQVTAKLHPAFVKHGIVTIPNVLSLHQEGNRTTINISVDFINADNPSDRVQINSWGHGIDQGDKGIGKAYSYAYKYALLKTFNLETGDDPDNDAKAVYKPDVDETLIKKFVDDIEIEDKESAVGYIKAFAGYHKTTIAAAIRDLNDKAKFHSDVEKWKAKHAKKKSA